MTAQYLSIEEKHRRNAGYLASIEDFTVTPGEPVNAEIILTNPNISLYCLDDAGRQAIFTELPDGIDLSSAPFVYHTQYEQARRLIAVPYDTFRQLAYQLPPIQNLIMIYNSGRSGSTLVSHLFNELNHMTSLSEPDAATQFVHLRSADGSRDAELGDLLDCTVRTLFKPTPFKQAQTFALKLNNDGIRVMDLYQRVFPQAKNLYLYRDAQGFVASFYRIFRRDNDLRDEWMSISDFAAGFSASLNYDLMSIAAYLPPGTERISVIQELTLWWIFIMEWYLEKYAAGLPLLAVRYADLNTHREQVVRAIFEYCGLPTGQLAKSLSAFERDSQAGTSLARENPSVGNQLRLNEEQIAEITDILARHPLIQQSDFIVPGTVRL